MRFTVRAIVVAAVGLMLGPQAAVAVDVEEQLRLMREQISQLEAQINEDKAAEAAAAGVPQPGELESSGTDDTLLQEPVAVDVQSAATEETPGVAPETGEPEYETQPQDRTIKSRLSSFIEATEISGWIAASYTYNFNNAVNRNQNVGRDGILYRTHPDNNTFSLDQLWFEFDKPVTEDSRAGFHVDLVIGKTAETLGGGRSSVELNAPDDIDPAFNDVNNFNVPFPLADYFNGNPSDASQGTVTARSYNERGDIVKLYTGYLSYLAPLGTGLQFDAGKLPTLLGAEVVGTIYNFNITRGLVWSIQPITNTGIVASYEFMPGLSASLGWVNDVFSDTNVDLDANKAITGQVAYATDLFTVAGSVIWGSVESGRSGDKTGTFDLLVTADPLDALSLWLNFDFQWFDNVGIGNPVTEFNGQQYGIALAGRYGITDRLGVSLRTEYLRRDFVDALEASLAGTGSTLDGTGLEELVSLTLTTDYQLTKNLQVRAEGRYDMIGSFKVRDPSGTIVLDREAYFLKGDPTKAAANQAVVVAEVVYTF